MRRVLVSAGKRKSLAPPLFLAQGQRCASEINSDLRSALPPALMPYSHHLFHIPPLPRKLENSPFSSPAWCSVSENLARRSRPRSSSRWRLLLGPRPLRSHKWATAIPPAQLSAMAPTAYHQHPSRTSMATASPSLSLTWQGCPSTSSVYRSSHPHLLAQARLLRRPSALSSTYTAEVARQTRRKRSRASCMTASRETRTDTALNKRRA